MVTATQLLTQRMPPPGISPEQILEHAPREAKVLRLDANVIAYFGDLLNAFRQGVKQGITEAPVTSAHTAPSNTASARSPS